MTVRCLDDDEKDAIVDMYTLYGFAVSDLARDFEVSRRTIYRVLDEQGALGQSPSMPSQTSSPSLWNRLTLAFRRFVGQSQFA